MDKVRCKYAGVGGKEEERGFQDLQCQASPHGRQEKSVWLEGFSALSHRSLRTSEHSVGCVCLASLLVH